MTDFNTDDNETTDDALQDEVDLDFGGPDTDGDEFAVEEVPTVEAPEGSLPVASPTAPKVKKNPADDIPPEEFKYDASPRPRQPKDPNAPEKPKGQGRSKDPLPEGWVTPTTLVKVLVDKRIVNIRPQAAFGLVKNGKEFPYVNHSDGRYIVPLEDGMNYIVREEVDGVEQDVEKTFDIGAITWIERHYQRKAERDARRAAEAAKAQENADNAVSVETGTPEVGGEGEMASVES